MLPEAENLPPSLRQEDICFGVASHVRINFAEPIMGV